MLAALTGGYRGLLGAREWLYGRGVLRSRALGCAVVSVGNLTVGGTGKTPAVELAVLTLTEMGHRAAVVSRGYRRRSRGVQIVADTASVRLDPEDAGDEPFLLARRLPRIPVVVGANRHDAARLAVERFGVTAVVLDDGFQHRTLAKDLEIVMTRAETPWGNGRLLPSGPLREPFSALGRADLIVAVGASAPADLTEVAATAARYAAVECWEAEQRRSHPVTVLAGARVLAFAGIAAPEAFEATLGALGARIVESVRFPDHHWYAAAELSRLETRAAAGGAEALVTTEKDWVRLRRQPLPRRPLYALSVRLELITGTATWRQAFERACPKP
jgi:tetraacyldisaccharide 4'-kinase